MLPKFPVLLVVFVLSLFAAPAALAAGGPVILGGDDLTDHGSVSSGTCCSGTSQQGWLYIEKAIGNIKPNVTRANDNSIAALGSADSTASSGDAGAAIRNAAEKNGMTVQFFNSYSAIVGALDNIHNGTYKPRIIWLAGTDATNDMGDTGCSGAGTEGQALIDRSSVISDFVSQGGGLMSHGGEPPCYEWLGALLPGLNAPSSGSDGDLYKTAAGNAAFPGVSEADFNAGPWHNHFEGNFGGLDLLVRSHDIDDSAGQDAAVVIGGSRVTFAKQTQTGVINPVPVDTCQRRPISLVTATPKGRFVYLSGLVARSLGGQQVRIVSNGAGASALRGLTTVRSNAVGQFTARVKRPRSRRKFIRARYRAQVGAFRSKALKLPQSLVSKSATQVGGGQIEVRGRVKRSLVGKRNPVVIKRLRCGKYRKVGSAVPDRNGNYVVRFAVPANVSVALFRAESMVLNKPGSSRYVKQYARAISLTITDETG